MTTKDMGGARVEDPIVPPDSGLIMNREQDLRIHPHTLLDPLDRELDPLSSGRPTRTPTPPWSMFTRGGDRVGVRGPRPPVSPFFSPTPRDRRGRGLLPDATDWKGPGSVRRWVEVYGVRGECGRRGPGDLCWGATPFKTSFSLFDQTPGPDGEEGLG